MQWIMPPVAGLIETTPALIVPSAHIGAIAFDGNMASIYYYSERPSLHGDGTEKALQVILERTPASVARGQAMMFSLIERMVTYGDCDTCPGPPRGFRPHVVR